MSGDAGLGSIIPAHQLDKLSEPRDCSDDAVDYALPRC